MTYMDFFGIHLGTMIPIWLNLLILYFIFKKFLYVPVINILKQREDQVNGMYTDAKSAKDNANDLEKEYTQKLALAKEEAGEIVKQATDYAKQKEEEILLNAQKEAVAIKEKANKQIEQEKKKVYEDIKTDVSELSVAIAEKIIKKEISKENHQELIDEFIENVR